MKSAAVFLDRDGTLNEMVYDESHGIFDSPTRPDQFKLKPFAVEFVHSVRSRGFKVFVVTNQPGLAKGTLTRANLQSIHDILLEKVGRSLIDEILVCPHHPGPIDGGVPELIVQCECRKPKPGLLLQAIQRFHLDPNRSWMIGDGITDIQAGKLAGCRAMLVAKLKAEHLQKFFEDAIEPDEIVPSLQIALTRLGSPQPSN